MRTLENHALSCCLLGYVLIFIEHLRHESCSTWALQVVCLYPQIIPDFIAQHRRISMRYASR